MQFFSLLIINWIYFLLPLIFGSIFYFIYRFGKSKGKEEFINIIRKGTGRYGIIKYMSYSAIDHVIEIEEIESAGDLTKVRVVGVCSCKNDKRSMDKILESDRFNEWVQTKCITWYDGNTQRIRDERLKEILE